MFVGLTLLVGPEAIAGAAVRHRLPLPPNYVHHTKHIGRIGHVALVCSPGSPTVPTPAITTLAYVAEASTNEVQAIDEATGALVGSPITVGSSPKGIAYWRPAPSSSADPLVVVTNAGGHSVTIVDAITQSVVATVSVPSGSSIGRVATSPTEPYAIAVDGGTGKVSVIDLANDTDAGEISLTSTANALSSIAFSASGDYAFVTDPTDQKIFTLHYVGGSAPYYTNSSTWTTSTYDPSSVATDLSTSSSSTLLVADARSGGDLLSFDDSSGTLSTPTVVTGFSGYTPGAVALNDGSTTAYVAMSGTKDFYAVPLSDPTDKALEAAPSSFSSIKTLALSADGSTLMLADAGSGTVQEWSTSSQSDTNSTAADSEVWAIGPALATSGAWNAYVVDGDAIYVVNTTTESIAQTITDGDDPQYVVASPDGQYVYVVNDGGASASVWVIATADVGTATNPVIHEFSISQGSESNPVSPFGGVAINPQGTSLLFGDQANGAVDVFDVNPGDSSSYFGHVVHYVGLSGSGISSAYTPYGVTVSPDGQYAYVTDLTGGSSDGVTVLSLASATTTGYNYDAVQLGLSQGSTTMYQPEQIAINPNDEDAYVAGENDSTGYVFTFPIETDGELANGTGSPTALGNTVDGVAFSPEDAQAFSTNTTSYDYSAIAEPAGTTTYTSSTDESQPQAVAVSPDGLYVAVGLQQYCDRGTNGVELFDAATGTSLGTISTSGPPTDVAFVPQSSPQLVTASQLVGGAANEAEAGVASGMNDEVTSGTPSDAPGATAGVDTATGAYSMSVDSMTIPDVGIPLDMTATYDSSRDSTLGLLGYGWDDTYSMTATQNGTSCVITVTLATGATVTFSPTTSSGSCSSRTYQPPSYAQARLTTEADCNGADSCWLVTIAGTMTYGIDETTGELVSIADANGNTVTITWGSHSACSGASSTDPCQVTGADSASTHRTLTFSYPSPGSGTCLSWLASCVVVTDPLGRTLTYGLNSYGQLIRIILAKGSSSATYAVAYASSSNDELVHWWDPNNFAAESGNTAYATDVTYNSASRVTEVTGPPIESVAPLSTSAITPTTTFAYTGFAGTTGNGTVLIQNPDFNQSNYEPGANQTLDTYAGYELVSSVAGYGPLAAYDDGSYAPVVPPNPSVSAYPMRDQYTLMASESMNALAGTTVAAIGTQDAEPDTGVTITDYDANANAMSVTQPISATDPTGDTTTSTYNQFGEVVTSTDGLGNTTTNTYNSTGQLLTTTSPATDDGGTDPKTSNWYNADGTLCASRDADQVAAYGTLSSCVSAGSNATTYTYSDPSGNDYGQVALTTVTDSGSQTSTTQNLYDADGDVCATLSPDGYAASGELSSCPSSATPYATVSPSLSVYNAPTKQIASLSVSGTDTYATTYTCYDADGNATATVGPMGSFTSCGALSPTTSVDATFTTYDPDGDKTQSIQPFAASGTQGPTTTRQFDANGTSTLSLSPQGYDVWEANNSATLTGYETGTLLDDQGNQVATAPQTDLTATCEGHLSTAPGTLPTAAVCPDTSVFAYDDEGQPLDQAGSGNGEGSDTTLDVTAPTNNPDGTDAGNTSDAGGSTQNEVAQSTYDANQSATNTVNEHWNGSVWVTDSATSTAYAPDGTECWTAPTTVSSPTCSSPPTGTATVDYYDEGGNLIAQVGPGGSGVIGVGTNCNPMKAFTEASAYSINTSYLCAFTTYAVYDEAGQLTETIEPSLSSSTSGYVTAGATTTYGYDASGNQTNEVNPAGNTVTSTYDGSNRLIGITYSDVATTNCSAGGSAQDTCYSYNADGTRAEMVDSTGTTTYSYDDAGQLASVTDSNGNTVTYGYDQFGRQNCISYPGFATADSCLAADNPNNGTNTIDPGEVWYSYDSQGRMQTVEDWNGDAFTYGYDCTGDVAWMAETPSSQIPSVTECAGSGGSVPSSPVPGSGGTTYVVTTYDYSPGSSGNLLSSQATSAVTHSGSTSLLEFDSLTYDDNNDLTSSTPKVAGTTETADTYSYDAQQRVVSGPETSGSKTAYSYINSSGTQPFYSTDTIDQMGIDAMPEPGATAQLGAEYAGNGELCWVAVITSTTTGSCGSPGSTSSSYETVSYNSSGDMTGTAATGYGANWALDWNVDTNEPTCINPAGISCTGPSSGQPAAQTSTYDANGLRMTAQTWNSGTSSVVTTDFTWDTAASALLSSGAIDYVYGQNSNVPIAQIDTGDSVTGCLVADPSANIRGVVEVSSSAAHPFVLDNYTDYDAYGTPITKSGGSPNLGGLTGEGMSGDADSSTTFGFGGAYLDPDGLVYLVHRYYVPSLGEFASVDPEVSSTNTPYSYAGDSPQMERDPSGLTEDGVDDVDVDEGILPPCPDGDADPPDLFAESPSLEFGGGGGGLTFTGLAALQSGTLLLGASYALGGQGIPLGFLPARRELTTDGTSRTPLLQEWEDTWNSFGKDDVITVGTAVQLAHDWTNCTTGCGIGDLGWFAAPNATRQALIGMNSDQPESAYGVQSGSSYCGFTAVANTNAHASSGKSYCQIEDDDGNLWTMRVASYINNTPWYDGLGSQTFQMDFVIMFTVTCQPKSACE